MSEYDIRASLETLEDIQNQLKSIAESIDDPITVINTVLNQRKDEIWYGGAASEYWEIIENQRKMMENNRSKITTLAEMVWTYREGLIEAEQEVSAVLDKVKN